MANIDGLPVNSAVTHAEFISRTEDSSTIGKLALNNTDPVSGSTIANTQRALNKAFEGVGATGESDTNVNNYVNNNYIVDGDNRKVAIEKLDAQAKIDADNLAAHIAASDPHPQYATDADLAAGLALKYDASNPSNYQTASQVTASINAVIDAAPGTLDTLNELAAALGDDPNFAATITTSLAGKEPTITATTAADYYAGDKTFKPLNAAAVGLTNVTNDSQLKRSANDFSLFAEKTTLDPDDLFLVEDSASSGLKKKVKRSNVGGGSGSGSGFENFIINGDAENTSTSIFIPYLNTASSRPVTGQGGAPTVATSITTVDPINKTKSFLITKPASNCQGQGWAIGPDSSIPFEHRGKKLAYKFSYVVNSGTFVPGSNTPMLDGDAIPYFYDVTNNKIVEPENIKLFSNSTTMVDSFYTEVQFDLNCTTIRPMIHIASSSALAWELKVDSVSVGPLLSGNNSVTITPWQSFIPTFTGFGTVTAVNAWWRRVGQNLEVRGRATAGTVTASGATIIFSSLGLSMDTSTFISDNVHGQIFGEFGRQGSSADYVIGARSDFTNYVYVGRGSSNGGLRDSDGNQIINANEKFSFKFDVPIIGWLASSKISDGYEGRTIQARYSLTSQTINDSTNTTVVWTNPQFDDVGMVNASNGVITCKAAGRYLIHASIGTGSSINIVSGNRSALYYKKNGGALIKIAGITHEGSVFESIQIVGSDLIDLKVNDTLEIIVFLDYGAASYNLLGTNDGVTYLFLNKSLGSQAVSSGEKIACSYYHTAGQSIPNNTPTIMLFNLKDNDSHLSYESSTGKLKLKRPGSGYLNATIAFTVTVIQPLISIYKNGSLYKSGIQISQTTYGASFSGQISGTISDEFDIRVYQNSGAARSLDTLQANNHFDFRMD